jgi:hypothetical protein
MGRRLLLVVLGACVLGTGLAGCESAAPATPVPAASLTCGSPDTGGDDGLLPDRDWTAVAWCPFSMVLTLPGRPSSAPSRTEVRTARGDLGPLLAALAEPNAPRSTNPCPAVFRSLGPFWLVDAEGQAYRPHVPKDPCGQPSRRVAAALGALTR